MPFDPTSQYNEALNRFEEIPDRLLKTAQMLCRSPQFGGGRVNIIKPMAGVDKDVVIVLHPTKTRSVTNLEGTVTELPAYVVFARSYSHTWGKKVWKDGKREVQNIDINVPELFATAFDEQDAYEVAHELVNAWNANREQEVEQFSTGVEVPFSTEFMVYSGMFDKGNWNSLGEYATAE